MAVKFRRNEDQKFDWSVRGRSVEVVRKRNMYIFGFIGIGLFASFVVHMITQGGMNSLMSSAEGEALVLEKIVRESAYFVRCEVEVLKIPEEDSTELPEVILMEDLVLTDKAGFDLVEEGDEIRVWYRVDRKYSKIRVHRMILYQTVIPLDVN